MDAARAREWLALPPARWMGGRVGAAAFVWAHVPMVFAALWWRDEAGFRLGLAAFAVAHAGLHLLLRRYPAAAAFNNPSSRVLTPLIGALGGRYLIGAAA